MVRIRLNKNLTSAELGEMGFEMIYNPDKTTYWHKYVGQYEIQAKLGFPSNLRIQDWGDNRAPWLLFKFLLLLEEGDVINGKVKVMDSGYYKILPVSDTLDLITELARFTDIVKRLDFWYTEYCNGRLEIK